jgi:hypothetical protein
MEISHEVGELGPAMRSLTGLQQRFVLLVVERPLAARGELASKAGYTGSKEALRVTAHRLMHNPSILAAIHEETEKRVQFGGLVGIHGLIQMAQDPEHKRHFAACVALADRGGFPATTEHKVDVSHTDMTGRAMVERVREMAGRLGLDPERLLGVNSVRQIEGEVVNVGPAQD